jgi:hypothetical protein
VNTGYESDQDDPVIRWMPRISLIITIIYGVGAPLVAILWIATGWIISDRRRKK